MFWLGLGLALVSAVAVNWAYAKEHDAAAQLPPLTIRRPLESVRSLLGARDWVNAFIVETAGWSVYVVALALSPLSLVQAVSAAGIAVLAFVASGGRVDTLSLRERSAVAIAVVGLVLLGVSLSAEHQSDRAPDRLAVTLWLVALAVAAVVAMRAMPHWLPAARYGLGAGLLFAGGDISAKLLGYGGGWLVAIAPLIVLYGFGTSTLQAAFQRGGALTAAGIATLTTNAVPIAAGFVLLGEELPDGFRGPVQVAAFVTLVASASLLGRRA